MSSLMQTGNLSLLLVVASAVSACAASVDPFGISAADQSVSGSSAYPTALHPAAVGTFPGATKSGAGYFYDEVLEYRVWLHPDLGAEPLAGKEDYFVAFAEFERAKVFSDTTKGAETPLALVRQVESINEPTPGVFVWDRVERITEWQVQWLAGNQRSSSSIPSFLAAHVAAPQQ